MPGSFSGSATGRGWTAFRARPAGVDEGRSKAAGLETDVLRTLILIALYAIPAFAVTRPVIDNDIWMNLRAGRWIVEHGKVPVVDPFSGTGRGEPWLAYNWLFEVLIYGLHGRFGLGGIIAYRATLSFATLLAIHRLVARRERRFAVATGRVGLAFLAFIPLLSERTWLFTILFCTLTLDVILDLREGKKAGMAWMLPPVYALWANVHIQFIYGLFLLALACVSPLIDRSIGRVDGAGTARFAGSPPWWRLVAVALVCLASTLLNPYHAGVYGVIVEYARRSETYDLVVELLASGFRMPWEWAMPALVGAAAVAIGRQGESSTFEVLLLSVASIFALRARRDVWFAVIAALAVLTRFRRPGCGPLEDFAMTWPRVGVIAAASIVTIAAGAWSSDLSRRHLEEEVAAHYPTRAAAFVQGRGYRGPLFNEYGWGSYLLWRLPSLPVSIDGRSELHGPARIRRNVGTMSGVRGWDRDPDLLAANTIIINAESALASLLRLDPRYELVHEDRVAAVFISRGVDDGGKPGDDGPNGGGPTTGILAAQGRGRDARGRGGDPRCRRPSSSSLATTRR